MDISSICGKSVDSSQCCGDQSSTSSHTSITSNSCGKQQLLSDFVKTIQFDNRKLLEQILKANDVSEQIELFCQTVALNEVDQQNRVKIKNYLQELLRESGFLCEFHFLGSTVNKLGFRDSDIDFYVELNPHSNSDHKQQQHRYDYATAMGYLETIHQILDRHLNTFVSKLIGSQRCPIIKLDFNKISTDREHKYIVCDLSLSNRLAVHNSKLLSFFCDIEPRFREMALILRYSAKINGFIGRRGFSSYAFTMLCVFFAQNCSPPLLPSVDYLMKSANQSLIIDGWECGFCDDKTSIVMTNEKNTETVIELIANFFKFYSRFDFSTQLICPKSGQSVRKSQFVRQNMLNFDETSFKITPFCCIQDPFDLRHNITAKFRHDVFKKFCDFIQYFANNNEMLFAIKQSSFSTFGSYWGIALLIIARNRQNLLNANNNALRLK